MLKQNPHTGVYTQIMRAMKSLRSLPLSSLALLEVVFPRRGLSLVCCHPGPLAGHQWSMGKRTRALLPPGGMEPKCQRP